MKEFFEGLFFGSLIIVFIIMIGIMCEYLYFPHSKYENILHLIALFGLIWIFIDCIKFKFIKKRKSHKEIF